MVGRGGSNKTTQRGASLIEAMGASLIIAFSATAIFPMVTHSLKRVRMADFQGLCINAARSKLNEFRYGIIAPSNGTQITSDSTGPDGLGTEAWSSGFLYTKQIYNRNRDAVCPHDVNNQPVAVPVLPPTNLADLGQKQCIVNGSYNSSVCSASWYTPNGYVGACADVGYPADCNGFSATDTAMLRQVPNFKLYVNLRRYNSVYGIEDCAWHASTNSYDFQWAGDMIKITVTGVIDIPSGLEFAGVTLGDARTKELTCQISDYIQPYPNMARYWMQDDGRIYRWISAGSATGTTSFEVFTSLYSAGNRGFVVSPDNRYVFILRPGVLVRYSGCTGDPINCDPSTSMSWAVPPNMVSIGAKFLTGTHQPSHICGDDNGGATDGLPTVFGLLGDGQTPVCISLNDAGPGDTSGTTPTPTTAVYNGQTDSGGTNTANIPFPVPATHRVRSIFTDPAATAAYVVDTTCRQGIGSTTYCGGIYSAYDVTMQYPFESFSVRAIAFSK